MSILDSVIRPADFKTLPLATRTKILAGVQAGARSAAAIEAKQRFSPKLAKGLAVDAKASAVRFKKTLKG
jgi:hypothetical protein